MFVKTYVVLLCILGYTEAYKSVKREITSGICTHYSPTSSGCRLGLMLEFRVQDRSLERCEDVCWYRTWKVVCDDDSRCKRITYGYNDNADTFEDCCPKSTGPMSWIKALWGSNDNPGETSA